MWREEVGSKVGKETLKRYGRSWMKELGKRGLRATANKYFAGSVAECMSYLRKKAAELQWLTQCLASTKTSQGRPVSARSLFTEFQHDADHPEGVLLDAVSPYEVFSKYGFIRSYSPNWGYLVDGDHDAGRWHPAF